MNASDNGHPIQVVARRTGLTADVIRIWERRYHAVSPQRTASGRRVYTDADVERLQLLRQATAGGRRIGDVAGLSTEVLNELVQSDQAAPQTGTPAPTTGGQSPVTGFLELCLDAVDRMDSRGLAQALDTAAVTLSLRRLLDELIGPLLRHIGERWRAGNLRVGQEHLAASVIRTFLGRLSRIGNMHGPGPTLVVTTPVGQNHEFGAMMAAITAGSEGWRVVTLNPNTPADEIAAAARVTQARAVALSLVYPPDDPRIDEELRTLRRQLPAGVSLLVGGAASGAYRRVTEEIGASRLETLGALRLRLQALRNA